MVDVGLHVLISSPVAPFDNHTHGVRDGYRAYSSLRGRFRPHLEMDRQPIYLSVTHVYQFIFLPGFPPSPHPSLCLPMVRTFPINNRTGLPEICAYGLRNPFRCGFDTATDELFCGDVGHTFVEAIYKIE